jgi:hypothetical protein
MYARKSGCDDVDWIQLAQNMDPLLAVVNTIMIARVPKNGSFPAHLNDYCLHRKEIWDPVEICALLGYYTAPTLRNISEGRRSVQHRGKT